MSSVIMPAFNSSLQESLQQLTERLEETSTKQQQQLIQQLSTATTATSSSAITPGNARPTSELDGMTMAVNALLQVTEKMNQSIIDTHAKYSSLQEQQSSTGGAQSQVADEPHDAQPKKDRKSVSLKQKITKSLESKDFDTAFSIALSAQNLDVVTWLTTVVSPEDVFTNSSALSQHVLISMIQQIGCCLQASSSNFRKLEWLQHCLVVLDVSDSAISAHVDPVLTELLQAVNDLPDSSQKKVLVTLIKRTVGSLSQL